MNTNSALYSTLVYERAGIDVVIINKVINGRDLMNSETDSINDGEYRVAVTTYANVAELMETDLPLKPDEKFYCSGTNVLSSESRISCSKQCPVRVSFATKVLFYGAY